MGTKRNLGFGMTKNRIVLRSVLAVICFGLPVFKAHGDVVSTSIPTAALQTEAEQGNDAAQLELSKRLYDGRGTPQNRAQALYWLEQSASRNNRRAEFLLSQLFEAGILVQANDAKTLYWLGKSANQGWPPAERTLGTDLLTGIHVKQRDVSGLSWLTKAASEGDKVAQKELAGFYAYGSHVNIPVHQDYSKSLFWTLVAIKIGAASKEEMQKLENDDISHLTNADAAKIKGQADSWSPAPLSASNSVELSK